MYDANAFFDLDDEKYERMVDVAIDSGLTSLSFIPKRFLTIERCTEVLKRNPSDNGRLVPDEIKEKVFSRLIENPDFNDQAIQENNQASQPLQ